MRHRRKGGNAFVQKYFGVPGYIYIARNDAHREDIYKIGLTTRHNPHIRIAEINRQARDAKVTGLIGQLVLVKSFSTLDCGWSESTIHARLAQYRYDNNREFFLCNLQQIEAVTKEVVNEVRQAVVVHGMTPRQLEYERRRHQLEQERILREQQQREYAEEQRKRKAVADVRAKYDKLLKNVPRKPFLIFWLTWTALIQGGMFVLSGTWDQLGLSIFYGAIVGFFRYAEDRSHEKKPEYIRLVRKLDQEIDDILNGNNNSKES